MDVNYKVILLGSQACGKTSLIRRFCHDTFVPEYRNTIGLAYNGRTMEYKGKVYSIGIWDTAGMERFNTFTRNYYRYATYAIICYDIFQVCSWQHAKRRWRDLRDMEPNCKVYLCGIKTDLLNLSRRAVDLEEVNEFAALRGCDVIEVSNRTGDNVFELFEMILKDYAESNSIINDTPAKNGSSFVINKQQKLGKKWWHCC